MKRVFENLMMESVTKNENVGHKKVMELEETRCVKMHHFILVFIKDDCE